MSQPPQAPPPPPPGGQPPPPPGGQAPPPQSWDDPGGAPPSQQGSNGLAIAALVTGIIGLLLSWIPFVNVLALVLGIVAVGTGIAGVRRTRAPGVGGKGLAVGGLVTGIIAILVSLLIIVLFVVGFSGALNDPDVRDSLDRLMEGENPEDVFEDLERDLEELEPRN